MSRPRKELKAKGPARRPARGCAISITPADVVSIFASWRHDLIEEPAQVGNRAGLELDCCECARCRRAEYREHAGPEPAARQGLDKLRGQVVAIPVSARVEPKRKGSHRHFSFLTGCLRTVLSLDGCAFRGSPCRSRGACHLARRDLRTHSPPRKSAFSPRSRARWRRGRCA